MIKPGIIVKVAIEHPEGWVVYQGQIVKASGHKWVFQPLSIDATYPNSQQVPIELSETFYPTTIYEDEIVAECTITENNKTEDTPSVS